MHNSKLFTFCTIFLCIYLSNAVNVLVLYPHKVMSIYRPMEAITYELANRGYNVTVITPISFRQHINITQLPIEDKFNYGKLGNNLQSPSLLKEAINAVVDGQREILISESVKSIMLSDIKIDLVISIDVPYNLACAIIPYRFKCPSVSIINHGSVKFLSFLFGEPLNLATNPDARTSFTDQMTFFERIQNIKISLLITIVVYFLNIPIIEQLFDSLSESLPYLKDRPPFTEIIANKSLMIVPTNHLLEYNYPKSPKFKFIAGLGIMENKPVPESFEKFISNEDFILISWGSFMTVEFLETYELLLMNTLKHLKQKIIWKSSNEKLQNLTIPKVMLTKWIPQQDLLAHKNMKLFITHGGLNSLTEATYYGVPVIVIPFAADQPKNAKFMEKTGAALIIEPKNITINAFLWAINEILLNPKYKNAAVRRSEAMRDRVISPVDEAVYWIEYVLKYGNVFDSINSTVPLYKQMLLDIMVFFIIIFIFMYYLMKYIIKFVLRFITKIGKEKVN